MRFILIVSLFLLTIGLSAQTTTTVELLARDTTLGTRISARSEPIPATAKNVTFVMRVDRADKNPGTNRWRMSTECWESVEQVWQFMGGGEGVLGPQIEKFTGKTIWPDPALGHGQELNTRECRSSIESADGITASVELTYVTP